jgi:hypothetical protein
VRKRFHIRNKNCNAATLLFIDGTKRLDKHGQKTDKTSVIASIVVQRAIELRKIEIWQ